jgi:hypothetical protein
MALPGQLPCSLGGWLCSCSVAWVVVDCNHGVWGACVHLQLELCEFVTVQVIAQGCVATMTTIRTYSSIYVTSQYGRHSSVHD